MTRTAEYGTFDTGELAEVICHEEAAGTAPTVRGRTIRLITSSNGWEPAGSCARWTDGYHAVCWEDPNGSRHGRRFLPNDAPGAEAFFVKLTA